MKAGRRGAETTEMETPVELLGRAHTGALDADAFHAAAGARQAHDASDRIIYNTTNGALWYDPDGLGGKAAVLVAVIAGHPDVAAGDFLILA